MRQNEEKYINEGYHVTVLGPPGVKDWFVEAWSFLGRMLGLRVIEMTSEDANKEQQEFGLGEYMIKKL